MNKWRLLAALVAVGLLVGSWQLGLFAILSEPERVRADLLALGAWGYLAFVLAFAILQPVGLPGIAFVVAAAYVWPRPVAYSLSMVGSLAASAVGFGFARFVAKDWVSKRIPPRLHQYDRWIERRGLLATAGLRAVFLMHPVLHGLFGVSRIRFSTYMLGCGLGYLPSLAVVTWASGSLLDAVKGVPKGYVAAVVGALVALFVARKLVIWRLRRRKKSAQAEAGG